MTDHPNDDVVRLDIPATARHVATARAVAASMAAAAGWTVDDIDDVRLALDELLAVLVEAAGPDDRVHLAVRVDGDGTIAAEGSIDGATPSAPTLDELSQRIIAAVADDYAVGAGTFRLTKVPARP